MHFGDMVKKETLDQQTLHDSVISEIPVVQGSDDTLLFRQWESRGKPYSPRSITRCIRPLTGTFLLVIYWSREIQRQVMTPPSAAVNGQIKKMKRKEIEKEKRSQVANDGNLEGKSSIRCRARSEVYSSARWSLWLSLHFETEAPPQIRGVALLHPCCCC